MSRRRRPKNRCDELQAIDDYIVKHNVRTERGIHPDDLAYLDLADELCLLQKTDQNFWGGKHRLVRVRGSKSARLP